MLGTPPNLVRMFEDVENLSKTVSTGPTLEKLHWEIHPTKADTLVLSLLLRV